MSDFNPFNCEGCWSLGNWYPHTNCLECVDGDMFDTEGICNENKFNCFKCPYLEKRGKKRVYYICNHKHVNMGKNPYYIKKKIIKQQRIDSYE